MQSGKCFVNAREIKKEEKWTVLVSLCFWSSTLRFSKNEACNEIAPKAVHAGLSRGNLLPVYLVSKSFLSLGMRPSIKWQGSAVVFEAFKRRETFSDMSQKSHALLFVQLWSRDWSSQYVQLCWRVWEFSLYVGFGRMAPSERKVPT